MDNEEFMANEIMDQLVGWRIEQAIMDKAGHFGFLVKKGRKEKQVWVLSDEEGNGSGYLSISKCR